MGDGRREMGEREVRLLFGIWFGILVRGFRELCENYEMNDR